MVALTKASDAAGIYPRGKALYLAYTFEKVQYKVNLRTRDYAEAVIKARTVRTGPPPGKRVSGSWEKTIRDYCRDKQDQAKPRPAHLAGKPLKSFRANTAKKTASCLRVFAEWADVSSPGQVTLKHLEGYYTLFRNHRPLSPGQLANYNRVETDPTRQPKKKPKKVIFVENKGLCWKGSEASARSKIRTIQAFLDHVDCLPGRVMFARGSEPEARQIKLPWEDYQDLIHKAVGDDLKFILYCGFHAGLRSGEITHCRSQWFNFKTGLLTIPGEEIQTLPTGKQFLWQIKDGDTRSIPIDEEFEGFLKNYKGMKQSFCMLSRRNSESGLYNWESKFDSYMIKQGHPEMYPHAMRHSWISHLCNCGNHTLLEVVAWSGDSVDTIEKNYWKKSAVKGALDATMAGKRNSLALREVAESLKHISTSGLNKETIEAIEALKQQLKAAAEPKPPAQLPAIESEASTWDWTPNAPAGHVKLYSVEHTVGKIGVFRILTDSGEVDSKCVTEDEWEDGPLATERARLGVLKDLGFIKRRKIKKSVI